MFYPFCELSWCGGVVAGFWLRGYSLFGGGGKARRHIGLQNCWGRLAVCDAMVNARQAKVTESFRWTYNSPFIAPCASNGCASGVD